MSKFLEYLLLVAIVWACLNALVTCSNTYSDYVSQGIVNYE